MNGHREELSIFIRIRLALRAAKNLIRALLLNHITLRQFFLELMMRVENKANWQGDDFNWEKYNEYYIEELKSISKHHTLIIDDDFALDQGILVKKSSQKLNLHPNHKLLYEVVMSLEISSATEVGCGAGDHISNLLSLRPSLEMRGIDRSDAQLRTCRERHSDKNFQLQVADITSPTLQLELTDLIYTQAVLMHISENDGRFSQALKNVFKFSSKYVVLMENWTQHNFLQEVLGVMNGFESWKNGHVYFRSSDADPQVRIMIVSTNPLNEIPITNYQDLLQGQTLLTH